MTPENIIEQWADYFNNADMKAILSLYHDHATLLPTFLPKLLASNNEIKRVILMLLLMGAHLLRLMLKML